LIIEVGGKMKKIVLITTATLALIGTPALAADMPVKAPPTVMAVPPSWSGFYGGLDLGARWANNVWTTTNIQPLLVPLVPGITALDGSRTALDSTAARIGAYGGYNWQIAPAWIVGLELDAGWANNRSTVNPVPGTGSAAFVGINPPVGTVKENWDGSLRGRLGTLITPDTLIFVAGGLALQQVELSANCAGGGLVGFCLTPQSQSNDKTMPGWTVGGGADYKIGSNWIARLEYRYADFGTFAQQFFPPCFVAGAVCDQRFTANVHVKTQMLNLGLAYRF
jgi:outer membrane immunogenic protein